MTGAPPPPAATPPPPPPPPLAAPTETAPRLLPAPLARLGARHPLAIAAIIVTVAVTLVATAATLAGFLAEHWWVFDIITSYRPQEAIALAVAVIMAIGLRCWKILPVALIALALNAWQVAPVYRDHQPAAATGSAHLSIAHINLQSSKGDIPAITRWLAGHPADIVVVLDTQRDLAKTVYQGVGDYSMVYPAVDSVTTNPKNNQPVVKFLPRSGEVVVLADIDGVTASEPTDPDLPSSSVEIQASIGDQRVDLLGLHTQSPTTHDRHALRDSQLDAVDRWMRAAPQPAVAFGDFNVTYYSPVLRHLLDDTGARSSQLGFGVQATWPVQFRPAGIGIDQSIYTGDLTAVGRRRGPSFGSEHRVLIVTYALAG
ncbi:MAG: endonuclease/exonuclease/phosphatase family protein [Acidimicrobiales bacterium]